jgi:hypothetical protein
MSTQTYSEKLRDPRWQKKRLEIMKRDKFKCRLCGDEKTELQIHHLKYTTNNPADEDNKNLITLCSDCHEVISDHKKYNCPTVSEIFKRISTSGDKIIFVKYSNSKSISIFTVRGENIFNCTLGPNTLNNLVKFLK